MRDKTRRYLGYFYHWFIHGTIPRWTRQREVRKGKAKYYESYNVITRRVYTPDEVSRYWSRAYPMNNLPTLGTPDERAKLSTGPLPNWFNGESI